MAETAAWWAKPRNVSICVDTPGWFDGFAADLAGQISARGDNATFVRDAAEVQGGGIAFYLSCMKLTSREILERNHQNIVVHASALPAGRGFSPIVWQVLEGENLIPISMILAADEADSGDILMRDELALDGTELNDEIRKALGEKIVQMCLAFLDASEPPAGTPQEGEPSWYLRRRPEDSRLNPERTIAEQFDLLRVVDNDRYPAFFDYRGQRYVLRISREEGDKQ
jgi:methionyl-tRNA formyltransferase